MDLEKLQEEASKDLKIDDTELDMESVRTPIIHAKYLKYQSKFSLLLKKAEDDYDVLAKDKWEYYTGCLLYTSPSPRDNRVSRMPSSA